MNVLFVSRYDLSRAPIAKIIAQNIAPELNFKSTGLSQSKSYAGSYLDSITRTCLSELGYSIGQNNQQIISRDFLLAQDLILCMGNNHLSQLTSRFPSIRGITDTIQNYSKNPKAEIHRPKISWDNLELYDTINFLPTVLRRGVYSATNSPIDPRDFDVIKHGKMRMVKDIEKMVEDTINIIKKEEELFYQKAS